MAKDRKGTGGPNLNLSSPAWASSSREAVGLGGKIVLCKFQYLYAGAALRMNARNNYQIMHVELVFLNPKPLKGKAKTQLRECIKQKKTYSSGHPRVGGGGLLLWRRVSLGILRRVKWRVQGRSQGFQALGCHQMTRCPRVSHCPS